MSTQEAENCTMTAGKFCWNELVTKDIAGSQRFYARMFGWREEAFGPDYTLFKNPGDKADDRAVGGMISMPTAPATGWLPYVIVENCDASVNKARELGAKIAVEAKDIPKVGRIAVIVDPQGAAIGIITPKPE